jgi:acetyltransferase-like isoleucine patch superfamily enzyme
MLRDEVGRIVGDAIHAGWNTLARYGAIGPRHRRARSFYAFGKGSMITFPPTVIFGEGRIAIGDGTTIGPLASMSAGMPVHAGMRGDPIITIGDRCVLGKGIGIVGHERIEIGNDIWTGHYIYITDQNHGYEDLELPIGVQMWKNDPVSIGDGSWLGHGAIVLPGSRIGKHCVVAAGAVVAGLEVPDYSIVAGVPARIVKKITNAR